MLVYNIINETISNYLQDFLFENKQEKTIRNKIRDGIVAITHLDSASTEVQEMTEEVFYNYVEHPMHDNIHKRQNNEIWAINFVIDRMMPYIIREKSDGGFFVNKSPRVKNAWENLVQAQSAEHVSKMPVWNSDDSLHYWNANKRYNDAMEAAKKQDGKTIEGQDNYSVYHIDGFKSTIEELGMTFQELGKYTGGLGAIPLCFTNTEYMYDNFTKNGQYNMYALLRDEWQDEECVVDESTFPFDSYGLSMIFVVIDNNGGIFRSNVRWNHGPSGHNVGNMVDHIFTYSKLLEVVGSNVMKQIGANAAIDNDFTLTYEVEQKLKQGIPFDKIFDCVFSYSNGYCMVELNKKTNYIDVHTHELISDIWFDSGYSFSKNGFTFVTKGGKCNYIREDGTFALDTLDHNEWLDSVCGFEKGFARVKKCDKWNYIRANGTLVWNTLDTNKWFDSAWNFEKGFAQVEKDGKYNFIRENGTLVWPYEDTNEWFEYVSYFYYGFARVKKDGNLNYLREEGTLVWDTLDTNEWFDEVYSFYNGFAMVEKDEKMNCLRENGTLVWDTLDVNEWFDSFDRFYDGVAMVEKDDKWNYIRENGTLVWDTLDLNEWFDDVEIFSDGVAIVEKRSKWNFIRENGTFVWPYEDTNEWFDSVWYFENGFAKVKKEGKFQYLSKDGKLYDKIQNTDNIIRECITRYLKRNLLK